LWVKAGHEVFLSSRHPDRLKGPGRAPRQACSCGLSAGGGRIWRGRIDIRAVRSAATGGARLRR
jgi:hypothetical protein